MNILRKFIDGAPRTANEIAQETGVSRQTVMKAIQFFIEEGYIASLGKQQAGSGKPPELFSLSTERYLLSIALWPDRQSYVLMDLCGRVIASQGARGALDPDIGATIRGMGAQSRSLLRANGADSGALMGVCVSTSGLVSHRENALRFNSLLPDWGENIAMAEALAPYFPAGTPILLENVGKVVGRALPRADALNCRRAMTIFSSWGGVCACLIEDGRILDGRDSLIGEVGHMVVAPDDDEICGCGKRGCFERQVSAERLRKRVAAEIAAHPDSPLARIPNEALAVGDVFRASAAGDGFAQSLADSLAQSFSILLNNVSVCFNPEAVVLQGDFAAADARFLDALSRALRRFRYFPQGGPFALIADARPIDELNRSGARSLLLERILSALEASL